MSAPSALHRPAPPNALRTPNLSRSVIVARAVLAVVWAAALVIAVGGRVLSTHSDIPIAAAALLTTYPIIDVAASVISARRAAPASARLLRINAGISTVAVAALAATAFGGQAASALVAFGGWAAVSGAIQLTTAIRHRRAHRGQLPMIISGGLSTLAGVSFIATANGRTAHLTTLAGYMTLGAVLYLIGAHRRQRRS